MTILIALLGVLLGLGLLQLRWLVFPPAPDLVGEVEQWRRGRTRVDSRKMRDAKLSPMERIARWVLETLDHYAPDALRKLRPDLAMLGADAQAWVGKAAVTAVGFALTPAVIIALRNLTGAETGFRWTVPLGAALAVVSVVMSVRDLREEAKRKREEFTVALSVYLDLVAMSLEAGHGHAQALPAAAQIGTGRAFTEIRTAIDLAPTKGIPAWKALGQMGDRYGIADLVSLRASMELAQDEGARVRASLIARAKTMRSTRLSAALERANNATQSMRTLTMLAAILAVGYVCAPYVLALRGAAG